MNKPDYKGFALEIMEGWPEPIGAEMSEIDLQDLAVTHGVLKRIDRVVPCGENCSCAEVLEHGSQTECYVLQD